MLVAYGDLICQLPQSVGLGMYGTNTIFLIVFVTGGTEDFWVCSLAEVANVVGTPIIFGSLLFLFILLYSVSSSTDIRSLQSECTLSLIIVQHGSLILLTFHIVHYSLSGGSFAVIRERILFPKNVCYSPF